MVLVKNSVVGVLACSFVAAGVVSPLNAHAASYNSPYNIINIKRNIGIGPNENQGSSATSNGHVKPGDIDFSINNYKRYNCTLSAVNKLGDPEPIRKIHKFNEGKRWMA